MGSIASINIAIMILTSFGFVMTTYRDKLYAMPDRINNRALAAGFGITGFAATITVFAATLILSTNILFNVLLYLNVW